MSKGKHLQRARSNNGLAGAAARSERNLLEVIQEALPRLSSAERKVAQAVLKDPTWTIDASMAAAARAADVSEPTVMRFCTAIGCDGFRSFRLRLAQSLAFGVPATHSVIRPGDAESDLTTKIFDYTIQSLDRARRSLDMEAIRRAIDLLSEARRIEFFGHGASNIIAQDAQQKFPLFGVPCTAHIDSHQQFMAAAMLGAGDVAVAISNTGHTTSVVECARMTRENGAAVIGITGSHGPLSDQCTVAIIVDTPENTDLYTPTISRIAGLVVIDLLAVGVAIRHDGAYMKKLQKMKRGLTAMRTAPIHVDNEPRSSPSDPHAGVETDGP
jgi:DNA-binding MurR/RpiR family transcriptional regulator